MSERQRLRVSTTDGKYTVIQTEGGGMSFLHHGEPWPEAQNLAYVGMVLTLAQDLETTRDALRLFREFVSNNATQWRVGAGHNHPIWLKIVEALGPDNDKQVSGDEYPLVRRSA